MFQASELSKKLPNWHFAPTCHGLIHVPGPECIVLFKVGFCAPLQDVCVCAWMDCPTDCPASVLPATYCPAKVLQAWPSHDWGLLLVGSAYYSTKLQEHLTWQVRSSGGLLALQRSPPNPCNSGNLRPHKQNKSSLLLKWSRSRQLQGSIKFSHTEYIQAFIPTHFEY